MLLLALYAMLLMLYAVLFLCCMSCHFDVCHVTHAVCQFALGLCHVLMVRVIYVTLTGTWGSVPLRY